MGDLEKFSLEGRVAIVTGGSENIGRGIAVGFAKAGADVAVVARTKENVDQVCEEIRSVGRRALSLPADVMNTEQVKDVVRSTNAEFGRIDILVNNAGGPAGPGFRNVPLLEMTDDDVMGCLDFNVKSLVRCSCEVVPIMMEQGSGSIINIASMGGVGKGWGGWGPPHMTMYNASKATVLYITKAMAAQWAPTVRVNGINPGFIDSPLVRKVRTPEQYEALRGVIGLDRYGTPEDIASAAVYLASDAASWVSASVLDVYGGAKWTGHGNELARVVHENG